MIPIFLSQEGCTRFVPALAICTRADRPRVSGTASLGRYPKLSALLAKGRCGSGWHTQDRARCLPHNLISMRQRRTTVERTMVVETQDD